MAHEVHSMVRLDNSPNNHCEEQYSHTAKADSGQKNDLTKCKVPRRCFLSESDTQTKPESSWIL